MRSRVLDGPKHVSNFNISSLCLEKDVLASEHKFWSVKLVDILSFASSNTLPIIDLNKFVIH